jgi:hypothetical protein
MATMPARLFSLSTPSRAKGPYRAFSGRQVGGRRVAELEASQDFLLLEERHGLALLSVF